LGVCVTTRESALSESDARQIAWDFRQQFRNSEAFELAWHALFELRTAVTPSLARRFLREELVKYRAHLAGLEEPPLGGAPPTPLRPGQSETYRCPGCERDLPEWSRQGHAPDCRNADCYGLEVRFREGLRKRRQSRKNAVAADV
jgi:hypothetical protein